MITYLNNASNEIEYTNKDGVVVTRNPFDPEFVLISQRLSLQHSNDAENLHNRNNYERAVENAQISIDAGRPPQPLPPVPLCIITPEDYSLPETTSAIWTPPLIALKPVANLVPMVPLGPASPARPAATSALDKAMNLLTTLGPMLPTFVQFLEALLAHHATLPPVE